MTAAAATVSEYDTSPESALEALASHSGLALVDLDETLYLQNSTEDFINLARPGLVATLILRLLETLKPWRFSGGERTRDVWRVRTICLLLPWTKTRWRLNVERLAKQHSNVALLEALKARQGRFAILTLGFQPIVEPLVAALGLPTTAVVGARLNTFEDRRMGKLHFAQARLGSEAVATSLALTDSLEDLPLLACCSKPLRTVWPGAQYRRALSRVYLPGEYITQVKRPGEQFIWRTVLQEDLVFWILGTIGLSSDPLRHCGGLAFLLASFWTIYERGYVDNDWAAANLEDNGKLSANYWKSPVATPWVQPWIWAFALGAIGVFILERPYFSYLDFAKWVGVLYATYYTFKAYNRVNKRSRVWLFAALQFARLAAPLVIVSLHLLGVAAFGALILSRWVPYHIYRLSRGKWPKVQSGLIRLLFFVVFGILLAFATGPQVLFNWTALALMILNIVRARSELVPIYQNFRRLSRERAAQPKKPERRLADRRRAG